MANRPKKRWTYRDAGVDIDEGDRFIADIAHAVRSTHDPRVLSVGGGFAGLFSLNHDPGLFRRHYRDPVLVGCTDGVGTKLKIAFEMGVHNTVGIDLVAMSANDLIVCGADPLFFLDYLATGKIERRVMPSIVKGVAEGCRQAGLTLLGGETAELPGFYKKGEYDLAGFAVGVVERKKILTGDTIEPGDVVLGIGSNGLHSNGYSLARKVLLDAGGIQLNEWVELLDEYLGEVLLRPTLLYPRLIGTLLRGYKVKKVIKAFANITGGGIAGNLVRVLPEGMAAVIDPATWKPHPIFGLIQSKGDIGTGEMYRVFNMGIGFCAVVSPHFADSILKKVQKEGFGAFRIGSIQEGKRTVTLQGVTDQRS
ncbi:MAG: phosphoribosylformylglycinamidine cyclo-ligase [Planctomycetota bacterium]|jgi:phosphoribosylformylglycinamidine cyclo-ligase